MSRFFMVHCVEIMSAATTVVDVYSLFITVFVERTIIYGVLI